MPGLAPHRPIWLLAVMAALAAWIWLMSSPAVRADGASQGPGHRVVFHVSTGDAHVHQSVMNNIRNLYEAVGNEPLNVEIVAHGAGLSLLVKGESTVGEQLARLKQRFGVEYTACSNTMKARGLVRDDLVAQVDRAVPAMVRLMGLQEQGWAYIKP
ncbi:hypothetical protein YTPLAS18_37050 [Nitrospira sp.]|nr:hypothetical protein YTPLAS18_37050 [Nitrospira sp.]